MLKTEMRNPKTTHIDQMSPLEIARIMSEENMVAVQAVDAVKEQIAQAIEAIAIAFQQGGRLLYMGAGTSGRLGVLDAAECPPTFGVPQDMVVGIIAGGYNTLVKAGERAEDSGEAGVRDLKEHQLTAKDIVVGISAAGGAAYVTEALEYAKSIGCITVGITSNAGTALDKIADISICPDTGPEVITGSTRLKAGTSQKLILNMLTTGAMIRCGYVYENLMINLKPSNQKLENRVVRIVMDLTGLEETNARVLLDENGWNIRQAVESYKKLQ